MTNTDLKKIIQASIDMAYKALIVDNRCPDAYPQGVLGPLAAALLQEALHNEEIKNALLNQEK